MVAKRQGGVNRTTAERKARFMSMREKLRGLCIGLVLFVTVVISVATPAPATFQWNHGEQLQDVLLSEKRRVRRFMLKLSDVIDEESSSWRVEPTLRFLWRDEAVGAKTSLVRVRLSWARDPGEVNCFVQASLCEHIDLEGRSEKATGEGRVRLDPTLLPSSRRLSSRGGWTFFIVLSLDEGSAVRGELSTGVQLEFFEEEDMQRAKASSSTAVFQEIILE